MKKACCAVTAAIAIASLTAMPPAAIGITGNTGFVSDYVFRGADASNGKAAAPGGLDVNGGMFYGGTWLSSVELANTAEVLASGMGGVNVKEVENSGVEIDLYAALTGDVGDFNWGAGANYGTYTDNGIGPFIEAKLSADWKRFSTSVNPDKFLNDERDAFTGVKLDEE